MAIVVLAILLGNLVGHEPSPAARPAKAAPPGWKVRTLRRLNRPGSRKLKAVCAVLLAPAFLINLWDAAAESRSASGREAVRFGLWMGGQGCLAVGFAGLIAWMALTHSAGPTTDPAAVDGARSLASNAANVLLIGAGLFIAYGADVPSAVLVASVVPWMVMVPLDRRLLDWSRTRLAR